MIVYFIGNYIRKEEVVISPDDRGFLFGDGVYEVIRSYNGRLFESLEHLDRLAYGLKELRMEGLDAHHLAPVASRLLAENGLMQADATIYIQVTRGAAPRSHKFPPPGTPLTIYVEPKVYSPPFELQQTGASAILAPDQRWSRCDIKTVGLLPNTLAHQRAAEAGAFEAIFSRNGLLQEGSHSSILFVKDGVLVLPPLTSHVLPSVTRSVVVSLAAAESIGTETRPCPESELFLFEEVLMLGTGVEIVPITSVNGHKIGNGLPGPLTRKLQQAFRLARGG
jgi:D-alanine transaminase